MGFSSKYAHFQSTRWSVIAASAGKGEEAHAALEHLCSCYWQPIYAFARQQGCSREDAQDYVQGFFQDLLGRGDLESVSNEKGRFRSFLLAAFRHYMLNQIDRKQTIKRGGHVAFISFDEGLCASLPDGQLTEEHAFDREWALRVLAEAMKRLRSFYKTSAQQQLFEQLKPCLTGQALPDYSELGQLLDMKAGAVKVAVHRIRQRYQQALREIVAETVDQPTDIDAELRYLREVLLKH